MKLMNRGSLIMIAGVLVIFISSLFANFEPRLGLMVNVQEATIAVWQESRRSWEARASRIRGGRVLLPSFVTPRRKTEVGYRWFLLVGGLVIAAGAIDRFR